MEVAPETVEAGLGTVEVVPGTEAGLEIGLGLGIVGLGTVVDLEAVEADCTVVD